MTSLRRRLRFALLLRPSHPCPNQTNGRKILCVNIKKSNFCLLSWCALFCCPCFCYSQQPYIAGKFVETPLQPQCPLSKDGECMFPISRIRMFFFRCISTIFLVPHFARKMKKERLVSWTTFSFTMLARPLLIHTPGIAPSRGPPKKKNREERNENTLTLS